MKNLFVDFNQRPTKFGLDTLKGSVENDVDVTQKAPNSKHTYLARYLSAENRELAKNNNTEVIDSLFTLACEKSIDGNAAGETLLSLYLEADDKSIQKQLLQDSLALFEIVKNRNNYVNASENETWQISPNVLAMCAIAVQDDENKFNEIIDTFNRSVNSFGYNVTEAKSLIEALNNKKQINTLQTENKLIEGQTSSLSNFDSIKIAQLIADVKKEENHSNDAANELMDFYLSADSNSATMNEIAKQCLALVKQIDVTKKNELPIEVLLLAGDQLRISEPDNDNVVNTIRNILFSSNAKEELKAGNDFLLNSSRFLSGDELNRNLYEIKDTLPKRKILTHNDAYYNSDGQSSKLNTNFIADINEALKKHETILVPVNHGKNHWVSLIIEKDNATVIDSLSGAAGKEIAKRFNDCLQEMKKDGKDVSSFKFNSTGTFDFDVNGYNAQDNVINGCALFTSKVIELAAKEDNYKDSIDKFLTQFSRNSNWDAAQQRLWGRKARMAAQSNLFKNEDKVREESEHLIQLTEALSEQKSRNRSSRVG